jgi:hypothetical protein
MKNARSNVTQYHTVSSSPKEIIKCFNYLVDYWSDAAGVDSCTSCPAQ